MVLDRIEPEHAHQLLGEYARQQVIGLRIPRFVELQRFRQMANAVPAVGVARIGLRQLLEQQAAQRAAIGLKAQVSRGLLRLRQIMLENLLEVLALERHQALVELAALQVFQGDGEPPVAEQASFGALGWLLLFVARHAPDLQLGGAVGDQQLDRARALHLQGDPSGALLIRAQKHVECGGMTQESCDIFGVVAAVQHALPGPGQAYQPSSNVQIFEEKSLNVVGLHGSKV